jgi:hypothetical protein
MLEGYRYPTSTIIDGRVLPKGAQYQHLFDSEGNKRASVYTLPMWQDFKQTYVPPGSPTGVEDYFDVSGELRGFSVPEGMYLQGFGGKYVWWKIKPEEFAAGAQVHLKFSEERWRPDMVFDGEYDRVIDLPAAEGMLFFDRYVGYAVFLTADESAG